jgi:peroxiredoxin
VLSVGDRIPDVQVWLAPREPVSLRELVAEGPVLVLFYLFDWSGT